VYEETGVIADFRSVLSLRHVHDIAPFGVSDIYVMCLLRPRPGESAALSIDTHEIEEAKWADAAEFAASTKHPLLRHAATLALHELRREQRAAGARSGAGAGAGETGEAGARAPHSISSTEIFFAVTRKHGKVYASAAAPPVA
jgi:hypothetical protein